MMLVRQKFPASAPVDIRDTLAKEFTAVAGRIKPGARIAVAVGSRGISNLHAIVSSVLELLRAAGAQPFIVPAMGSHGGATPEGQKELLAEYGITEAALGVPIRAAMEARCLGTTEDGVEVFFSEEALKADGVVVVNRVKPHTDFQSDTLGSGLMKMLVVGLGKRVGAANYHISSSRFGYERVIRTSARITLRTAPILFGVAIVENQSHDTARLAVVLREDIERREGEWFVEAKRLMPRLPFDDIDLLIVDRIGKNISGSGMDPNIIGRSLHGYSALLGERNGSPSIGRIFVRDLTPESHGNAVGVGLADFTTTRLVRQMDAKVTYLNALTALSLQSVKVPIHFETDREAVAAAMESLALRDTTQAKVVRILHTLSLERVAVSESYAESVRQRKDLEVMSEPETMRFDTNGILPTSAT
jgi:Lactate racemase N-terminal domain